MLKNIGINLENAICVDASCILTKENNSFGPVEYQAVSLVNGQRLYGSKKYPKGTINVMEFLAIVSAMKYIKDRKIKNPVIFSDSLIAINWVSEKRLETTLPRDKETEELYAVVDKALEFLRMNEDYYPILKWQTSVWGENPADYGRK